MALDYINSIEDRITAANTLGDQMRSEFDRWMEIFRLVFKDDFPMHDTEAKFAVLTKRGCVPDMLGIDELVAAANAKREVKDAITEQTYLIDKIEIACNPVVQVKGKSTEALQTELQEFFETSACPRIVDSFVSQVLRDMFEVLKAAGALGDKSSELYAEMDNASRLQTLVAVKEVFQKLAESGVQAGLKVPLMACLPSSDTKPPYNIGVVAYFVIGTMWVKSLEPVLAATT